MIADRMGCSHQAMACGGLDEGVVGERAARSATPGGIREVPTGARGMRVDACHLAALTSARRNF